MHPCMVGRYPETGFIRSLGTSLIHMLIQVQQGGGQHLGAGQDLTGEAHSTALWLRPSRQGMKIIPE